MFYIDYKTYERGKEDVCMLGKVIKYEWKKVGKVGLILFLTILAVTVLEGVIVRMPFVMDAFSVEKMNRYHARQQNVITEIGLIVSLVMYALLVAGCLYGLLIYLTVRFYKTMFTAKGYLTHTLPVKPHQLLLSKLFVGGMWYIIIQLAGLVSFVVVVILFGATMYQGVYSDAGLMDVWLSLWEAIAALIGEYGVEMVPLAAIPVWLIIIAPFTVVMMLFGSFTVGQLAPKGKVVIGIATYAGVMIVNGLLTFFVQIAMNIICPPTYENIVMYFVGQYISPVVVSLIIGIVMYIVSHLIISKHLNLD